MLLKSYLDVFAFEFPLSCFHATAFSFILGTAALIGISGVVNKATSGPLRPRQEQVGFIRVITVNPWGDTGEKFLTTPL